MKHKASLFGAAIASMLATGFQAFSSSLHEEDMKRPNLGPRHRASKPVKVKRKAQRVARRQNRK